MHDRQSRHDGQDKIYPANHAGFADHAYPVLCMDGYKRLEILMRQP